MNARALLEVLDMAPFDREAELSRICFEVAVAAIDRGEVEPVTVDRIVALVDAQLAWAECELVDQVLAGEPAT